MKPEPTQKGNPHQLTRWQHLFPKRSIGRFCNERGVVDLKMSQLGKRRSAKPTDKIFCVERVWNEQAENGYGKYIEDEFQKVVDRVLRDNSPIFPSENMVITKFYSLWNVRHYWSKIHMDDEPLKGITGLSFPLTADDQEQLEKAHISYPTNELTVPARQIHGMKMQANLLSVAKAMTDVQWGILSSSYGEFIVPDSFSKSTFVPVSPNTIFVGDHKSMQLTASDVSLINMDAVNNAERYFFARDLEKCPGVELLGNSK